MQFLHKLITGKLPFITPLSFDVENHNIFHIVQKIHTVIIDIAHIAFVESMEDNVAILNKRTKIMEDIFIHITNVSH